MAYSSDPVILAIIAVSVLLLGAKLLAELFARLNLPVVLGELTAGIILGPFYFGGLVQIQPNLVEVNDIVLAFAQIGGIVILFVASLGMPLREFVKGGAASFTTGTLGVLLPFFGGLLLFTFAGRLNQRPNDILGTLAWSLLLVAKMNPSIFTDRRCTQMCAAEVGSKHTPGAPGQIFFAGVGHGETRSCLL